MVHASTAVVKRNNG
ncbi:BnaA09g13860D [Brassica napus]|uniref:BnaA09g13860D protein n=1 Tax=Brassica napus TaxID=3708 RepID=A0A078FL32_BRANA|nr:BnaA09g13860D [Brassica napus]